MTAAQIILLIAMAYVLTGLAVAIAFVLRGIARVDPAASGTSAAFWAVIIPGAAALWPIVLRRWLAARSKGVPHDTH